MTILICACCVVPIVFASITSSVYVPLALIALATAAHQGWSANLFTTVSDQFPRRAVGNVVGFGGLMGGLGGALLAAKVGVNINTSVTSRCLSSRVQPTSLRLPCSIFCLRVSMASGCAPPKGDAYGADFAAKAE